MGLVVPGRPFGPVAEDRRAGGIRDLIGPVPAVHAGYTRPAVGGAQRAPAVTTGSDEPQVSAPPQPRPRAEERGGSEFESPAHLPAHPPDGGVIHQAYGCILAPGLAPSDPSLPVRIGRHRGPWPGVASTWVSTSEWLLPQR